MPAGAAQQTPECGSRDTDPPISAAPALIRPGRPLGAGLTAERPLGRSGRIWLARDRRGQARVLKTGPRAAIAHEGRVLAGLAHPAIVRAIDCIELDGAPALVLEHLGGGDLVSLSGQPAGRWLDAVAALVAALRYLHGAGYIHRDLKARNVMFAADGRARLIDFGSAAPPGSRWTDAGTTAAAVAPWRGTEPVSPDDDAYAVAALIYELIHGRPPGPGPLAVGGPAPLAGLVGAWLRPAAPATPGAGPRLAQLAAVIESLTGVSSS